MHCRSQEYYNSCQLLGIQRLHGLTSAKPFWNDAWVESRVAPVIVTSITALVTWMMQMGRSDLSARPYIEDLCDAAEERWGQSTALVLMLPHGLEGQGPDHSSARIERFLQLCNDDPDSLPGNNPALRYSLNWSQILIEMMADPVWDLSILFFLFT